MLGKIFHPKAPAKHNAQPGGMASTELDVRIGLHYGIPSTASIMAFDPIQRLLAIGTLDGRIKVIGGDNIEGLFISPKQSPHKCLEFLHNQGYLISVSNENDIEVWDLELRRMAYSLQWDANITAFSIIQGTCFMYIGDEHGLMSVVKYDTEERTLLRLPYHTTANGVTEAAGISLSFHQPIVGILPQPHTSGNKVLIAYENGLIILWDVSVNRAVVVRGYTSLQLKDEKIIGSSTEAGNEIPGYSSDSEHEEKVICSLCWASTCGSILAVGYIDGDILLWNMSSSQPAKGQQPGVPSNSVVKLQLSSADRRLPIIVLHWSPSSRPHNNQGGQLFIYGGAEIGSEEVLTVLSIEWSTGIETLKCIARVDLSLNGSFADMILIPNAGASENNPTAALFILTNPGQLHVYDGANLSNVTLELEKSQQFPVLVPIIDPSMTISKISLVPSDGNHCKALLEIASSMKNGVAPTLSVGSKWPLTGGVPSPLSFDENIGIERIYIAGYRDGSIRIWDATYPVLSPVSVLEGEVPGINVAGTSAAVSALDFCSITMSLAVGNECGLVHVYKLCRSSDERSFHSVSATEHEVHSMACREGFCCIAVFSVMNSPVRTLQFVNSGAKLTAGFECGQVAMFDMGSLSVVFQTDCVPGSSSPVISVAMKVLKQISSIVNSPKHQQPKNPSNSAEGVLFILTRNAHVVVIDSVTGNRIGSQPFHPKNETTAISMYVIDGTCPVSEVRTDKLPQKMSQDNDNQNGCDQSHAKSPDGTKPQELERDCSNETLHSAEELSDSLILLCCEDALRLYTLKSIIQGESKSIRKVNLRKHCCWSTTFKRDQGKASGLILLYQTGALEIRSLPDLEVVGEVSLMSTLRWSFKTNMDKTISSNNGLIALVNGNELAFISLLACENDFRIPDSLPCLHDKVLAAAADAAATACSYQRKKQGTVPGIFGGIIKGLKGGKMGHPMDHSESSPRSTIIEKLDDIFSRFPFSDPSTSTVDQDVIELSIDDIEIDDSSHFASTSSNKGKHGRRDEEMEREKLFHGATSDVKPRVRTAEEIRAQYRKTGDVSAVATDARDKLAERGEKLERISRRTEELQSGAESFASMANELAKRMEARKWWQI
eukprot:TRINITY_DN7687_c0_g1_i1.p1 TRINITY_DN7687_c0_g1~~TRINITY_DN7687_c0_g1_i1.p1  ORF type:complete len:1116 (-),score=226.71 TRINITY_DN7687_c0_g1_i1:399-3746(-)